GGVPVRVDRAAVAGAAADRCNSGPPLSAAARAEASGRLSRSRTALLNRSIENLRRSPFHKSACRHPWERGSTAPKFGNSCLVPFGLNLFLSLVASGQIQLRQPQEAWFCRSYT